jgi:hypothetical protein
MKFFLGFILLLTVPVAAENLELPKNCGQFLINGSIELGKGGIDLVVFKSSRSEVRLRFAADNAMRIMPFLDQAVEAEVTLNKPIAFYRGVVSASSIRLRNPFGNNPAEITDGFTLLKEQKCD